MRGVRGGACGTSQGIEKIERSHFRFGGFRFVRLLSFLFPGGYACDSRRALFTLMMLEGRLLQMAATGAWGGIRWQAGELSGRSSICIYLEGVSRQTTIVIYINAQDPAEMSTVNLKLATAAMNHSRRTYVAYNLRRLSRRRVKRRARAMRTRHAVPPSFLATVLRLISK